MTEMGQEMPTRVSALERLPAERFLVLVAGALAIGIGILAFALELGQGRFTGPTGDLVGVSASVMTLVFALAFGVLLLATYRVMAENPAEGAVLAVAFSVVLLIFGGIAGVAAGILGVIGAAVAVVRRTHWSP